MIGDSFYPCGKEAAEFLQKLFGDQAVTFLTTEGHARVGKNQAGSCFVAETNLEIEMVRNGWALAHHSLMTPYEIIARENKRGLWRGKFIIPERWLKGERLPGEIDRRIHWLTKRLETVTVVEPRADGTSVVYFGAYVEVEDEVGTRVTYRIVGEDEIDLDRGHVSWKSPVGRALLRRKAGDDITVQRPSGEVVLTVVTVRY